MTEIVYRQREMNSAFPRKPLGKGPSRFSKALPTPPEPPPPPPITKDDSRSTTSTAKSLDPALPPIPRDLPPLPQKSTMSIPRRPVGASSTEHSEAVSIASTASTSSSSLGFSRSISNSSNKTKDSLSGIDSESDFSPPLPPKDSKRQQHATKSTVGSSVPEFQTSPPRPEIWRRRSVKSDRSAVFSELKLTKSNGSTAGPPPDRELPTLPSQFYPPRPQAQKLLPARPAPPQPDFGGMGNKFSKLKEMARRGSNTSEDVQAQSYTSLLSKRQPIPEHLKSEKQQKPVNPQVLPAVSQEAPAIDDAPPAVPETAGSQSTSSLTIVPDTVLADATNRSKLSSSNLQDSGDTLPKPNLPSHSRGTSETLTVTSELQVGRSPQPQKACPAKILTPTPSPPPEQLDPLCSPPPLISPAVNLNIYFPKATSPATPGTMFQGPELGTVHLDCYRNHNQMRHSKNTMCPVACMICRKKESGPRWRCSWCSMSACGACMKILASILSRDLRVCVERIDKRGEKFHRGSGSGSGSGS